MCASVSAETYTCLCLCVINHCLTLYRTHNARALFTPLKINSSTSDMLTILRRENCSTLLTQLQQKKLPERYMCSVLQWRGESGNLKMNVARGSSRASIQKRHGNTATLELVNNSFELFEEIPFKVSERFHFACGLPLWATYRRWCKLDFTEYYEM